jgi:ATP-binding cassette subfamily B protein
LQPFFRIYWPIYSLGVVILIIVDLLQLTVPRIIGAAVDNLITNREDLVWHILTLTGVSLLIAVLRYIYRECIMGTTRRLEYYLRKSIFSHALRLPMSFFDEYGPGKIMALTTNDVSAIRVAIGLGIMLFVDAVIMGIATTFHLYSGNLYGTISPRPLSKSPGEF